MQIQRLFRCSFRYRVRVRYLILIVGLLVIIAAVYQRYHYVIDIVAGVLFAILCLLTCRAVYGFIRTRILQQTEP